MDDRGRREAEEARREAEGRRGRGSLGDDPPFGNERYGAKEGRLEDRDELRVQRAEEEIEAGTRERQAGAMKVTKKVRTEREQVRVPKKREEVSMERVPVGEEAPSGAELGEDEIVIQILEEEIVVSKRLVVKEEIRIRKEVVEEEEIVEADVRREEVEIEDTTGRIVDRDGATKRGEG